MPRTRLSTQSQLDEIRQGLLNPAQLWAQVAEIFLAGSGASGPGNQPVKRWATPDGWTCTARTRREARIIIKRATGRAVKGLRVVR